MDDKDDIFLIEEYGVFPLTGEIDDDQYDDVVRWIIGQNFANEHDVLTMLVNSPGGAVDSGFAIIDAMGGSKIPIKTVGVGNIASMGLLIFISGKKGERILTPNTLIMSHEFSSWREGKRHELLASVKRDDLIEKMIMNHYKKHTGLSEKKIRKYLLTPSDVYLTASEAKELGICDEIKLWDE